MARARMKLTGLKELQRTLQKLPDELQAPAVKGALIDAAEPMRREAVDLAPHDEGDLEDSIVVTDEAMDPLADRPDEVSVYFGVDVEKPTFAPHGHLVEFGTGPRYLENGKYVGEMPAQPFMRPSFDNNWKGLVRAFGSELGRYIESAAATLAGKNK